MSLIVLACTLDERTGEGRLGSALVTGLREQGCAAIIFEDVIVRCLRKNCFFRDRLLPFYLLIVAVCLRVFSNHKVLYLNYVPSWNFLTISLSRIGVSLGPITGSHGIAPINAGAFQKCMRQHFLVVLSKLSSKLIDKRKPVWAATPSVYNLLSKAEVESYFARPFLLLDYAKDLRSKRDEYPLDFFIYCTPHPIKNLDYLMRLLCEAQGKFKISAVGDSRMRPFCDRWISSCQPEEFQKQMKNSKGYITFSYEDAGIAAYQAALLKKPLIFPA